MDGARPFDHRFVFQTSLELGFEGGILARANRAGEQAGDWDDRVADLQFRAAHEHAVGHGVAVLVPERDADGTVRSIRTTWLPRHEVRRVVTGGGKTEAYLGVIAFTLVLRRLRGQTRPDGGLGVAVLLRYTLRLLTLDQLDRAATLVCALELLRRADPDRLGGDRFAVGLWVGRSATANTLAVAAREIEACKVGNGPWPHPLVDCPWCRAPLEPQSLRVKGTKQKAEAVIASCRNWREVVDRMDGRAPMCRASGKVLGDGRWARRISNARAGAWH